MITLFNAQLLDVSMNSATLANTVGANGQISYDYEEGKIYLHDGFGNLYSSNLVQTSQAVGSTYGYVSGGAYLPTSTDSAIIDKFSLSTDGNASDVGDLLISQFGMAGHSSKVSGYKSGGLARTASPVTLNSIEKFSFSVDNNSTDVGDLTQARFAPAGHSSRENGYASGGANVVTIDKFPFSADSNASDVGDLTSILLYHASQSSTASGYTGGGNTPTSETNIISKFSFATNSNATDVGDLTQARRYLAGQNSSINGYNSAGDASVSVNVVDKFPFATDSNATDVGDLTQSRTYPSGQSSTTSGYTSGGVTTVLYDTIDKFPFSTDTNASDVGSLSVARSHSSGQQI